jgi:hypothetical protein
MNRISRPEEMSLRHLVRVICQALVLVLLISLCSSSLAQEQSPSSPQTPAAWSAAAVRDVNAAYAQYAENHPGMFNELDPGFRKRLARARRRGLELAAHTVDEAGLAASLDAFSAELRDPHALVFADPASPPESRWPGFVAVWRGNAMFVFASEVPELKPGAKILGCDGVDTRTLVLRNVFAFVGRQDEPGQWWIKARYLFNDDGNPFVKLPVRCRFSTQGQVTEAVLHWRPTDQNDKTWRKASFNGDILPVGMTQPLPGIAWMALPTFQPDAAQRETYRTMFTAIRARRAELLADKAIVIDLRGNLGGSSAWSEDLAKALWGDSRVEQFEASDPSREWWRASRDNTDFAAALAAQLETEDQKESAAEMRRVADGMRAAVAGGQRFFVEPPDAPPLVDNFEKDPPPLTTPVYVIVPGSCVSACLDALDVFTHFPNTKLIGAPSSADSVYIEVRHTTLPDGTSKIVIPVKMYRNRRRASGQAYHPALEVDDLSWSTAAFQKIIESDLTAAK